MSTSEVAESTVGSGSWIGITLRLEMLIDNARVISTEHGLGVSNECRVVILIQIVLRTVNVWAWRGNLLGWDLKPILSFAKAILALGVII